jgi:hypothetical protein
MDAGDGIDDYLVMVTEAGEIIVYKGTDPSSANTFGLVGVWYIGDIPKGRRAYVQYAGDLLILCSNGLFPVSQVVSGGLGGAGIEMRDYISKIQRSLSSYLANTYQTYGWQIVFHSRENLLLINVPNHTASTNRQYAMQTVLSAWCEFSGIPYACGNVHFGFLFAGTDDERVLLLNNGVYDGRTLAGDLGDAIDGEIIPAFTGLGAPASNKRMLVATVRFRGNSAPSISLTGLADFKTDSWLTPPPLDALVVGVWDDDLWDQCVWGGDDVPIQFRRALNGEGNYLSYQLRTKSLGGQKFVELTALCEVGNA